MTIHAGQLRPFVRAGGLALLLGACGLNVEKPEVMGSESTTATDAAESEPLPDPFPLWDPQPAGCGYRVQETGVFGGDSVLVADFDGDGFEDLGVVSSGTVFQVFHGDGSGRAFRRGFEVVSDRYGEFGVGDFDGNGWTDLVHVSGGLDVWLNHGGALYDADLMLGGPDRLLAVADVDGDGDDDIVYGSWSAHVAVWDDGEFKEVAELAHDRCWATVATAADFDRDGARDVAVAGGCNSCGEATIAVHLQHAGTFTQVAQLADADVLANNCGVHFVEAGHFDGDGVLDLISDPTRGFALYVHLGQGGGRFAPRHSVPMPELAWPRLASDLDLDGLHDLIAEDERGAFVLRNTGDLAFERCDLTVDSVVLAHDLIGDARPELLGWVGGKLVVVIASDDAD